VPKRLSERWHRCPFCGASRHRDHHSARSIWIKAGAMVSGDCAGEAVQGLLQFGDAHAQAGQLVLVVAHAGQLA
jgi:hypothetical protein